jgi:hypothetical protein
MMRNVMIAAIGAGLLAISGTANAQPVVVGSGPAQPPPGSGDSARVAAENRDLNADYNQRIGAANLDNKSEQHNAKPRAVPATVADIKAGAALRDINGVAIGTIVSLDGEQAIVDTGQTKIGVPVIAFGKDNQGLLLGMTADKFNQLVAAAHAKSQASN